MSFLHPTRESKKENYLLTISIVLISYLFIGQIPLFIAYVKAGDQTLDVIRTLQTHYGLTITFLLIMFPLLVVFFALIASVKYIHKWPVLSIFTGRKKMDIKRIFIGFFSWMILSLGILSIDFNAQFVWNFNVEKFIPLALLSLLIIPIQCAAEELFFRGYLYQLVGTKTKKAWIPIVITGAFFGILHVANPEVVQLGSVALTYYIWSGFFLGILTFLDDGLELPLGYHIANNLFATLIVTNDWQAFQTDALFIDTNPPSFTLKTMGLLLFAQLLFVIIGWKVFKWKIQEKD